MALTDYIIMPGADYQAACDKIREKSGKTDLIKSSDLASEIEAIAGNAGSGSVTKPYVEYTTNESNYVVGAKLYGFTTIPAKMFYQYTNLVTVDLSGCPNLTAISDSAFQKCTSLTSVDMSVCPVLETIGVSAFQGCTKLRQVALPTSVTTIGRTAFSGCSTMLLPELHEGLTTIDALAFSNCSGGTTNLVLPASLTNIGSNAFYSINCLDYVEVKPNLSPGYGIFQGCQSLKAVWIRNTCDTIIASSIGPFEASMAYAFTIYAEDTEKQIGWGEYFNKVNTLSGVTATEAPVVYGQTECPW